MTAEAESNGRAASPARAAGPADRTLRSADDLVAAGLATTSGSAGLARVAQRYAVAISSDMQALIDPHDPDDPIARQFVPRLAELETTPEERADPIGDDVHSPLPGLVHRYPDRVLLKIVGICPVYCRFCFRRETVGPPTPGRDTPSGMSAKAIDDALCYIAARPEIFEVIMTGGDPFMISARRASELTRALAAIPHVKVLRWHTRVPVVDAARVTPEFVAALQSPGVATYVAIHANHSRELTSSALAAISRLADAGISLLSQTVLLRGVNDDAGVLADLMRAFVAARVKPYYLHHPDLAPGTSHFRMSLDEGQKIVRQLRGHLSGLCQPTYVLDIPGGYGKVPVGPDYVHRAPETSGNAGIRVRDYRGRLHDYPPRSPADTDRTGE